MNRCRNSHIYIYILYWYLIAKKIAKNHFQGVTPTYPYGFPDRVVLFTLTLPLYRSTDWTPEVLPILVLPLISCCDGFLGCMKGQEFLSQQKEQILLWQFSLDFTEHLWIRVTNVGSSEKVQHGYWRYGIFPFIIYHKFMPNVGQYTNVEHMG